MTLPSEGRIWFYDEHGCPSIWAGITYETFPVVTTQSEGDR